MGRRQKIKKRTIFITATDTNVGKTVAGLSLALQLKSRGFKVGYFKPVQCAGNDAEHFKQFLDLPEPINRINPYFAREPHVPANQSRRA